MIEARRWPGSKRIVAELPDLALSSSLSRLGDSGLLSVQKLLVTDLKGGKATPRLSLSEMRVGALQPELQRETRRGGIAKRPAVLAMSTVDDTPNTRVREFRGASFPRDLPNMERFHGSPRLAPTFPASRRKYTGICDQVI